MNDKRRFHHFLREFDLSDPAAKLEYNRRLFSPVAEVYPLVTRILSFGRDAAWKRMLLRSLPQNGVARVLDLACGPGDLTFPLAERYATARITGIDLNPDMLNRARAALEGAPVSLQERITFTEGDMNALAFPDAGFDLITGGYALRNSPDLKRTLAEVGRMLEPFGTVAFLDFSKSRHTVPRNIQLGLLAFWGRLWGRIFHRNPEVYGYIAESLKQFPDQATFQGMLEEAGFRLKLYRACMFGLVRITVAEKRQNPVQP